MHPQEEFVASDSRYYVYSPSKNALEMFLYPLPLPTRLTMFLYQCLAVMPSKWHHRQSHPLSVE